jgi:hypothetical protein
MNRFFSIGILLFCLSRAAVAQEVIPKNPFGFAMNEPKSWVAMNKAELGLNLERFDLSKSSLEQFLLENQGNNLLFAYSRFKQDSFTGINPKIEARVVKISSSKPVSFTEFRPAAIATLKLIASRFEEQRYIVEPSDTKVAGIDAVYHISEFTMRARVGTKYKVRSRTYLVPRGTYFFQISFVDEPEQNDCSSIFDELVASIKIVK